MTNPPTLAVGVWDQTQPYPVSLQSFIRVSLQNFRRLPFGHQTQPYPVSLQSFIRVSLQSFRRLPFGPPFDTPGPWGREGWKNGRFQPVLSRF